MKGIAPEIDRLMWKIAEDRDETAAADFSQQFPHLRAELEGRMSMVRNLRGAKGAVLGSAAGIPQFEPRYVPTPLYSNKFVWAGALAVLSVMGVASYFVTTSLVKPEAVVVNTRPAVYVAPSNKEDVRQFTNVGIGAPPTTTTPGKPQPYPKETQPAAPIVNELRPQVRFTGTPLVQVLQAVAAETQLTLELAPRMPNPEIDAHYENLTGLEILADLGRKFGFKAFPQEGKRVLIVPTIEAWEPNTDITGTTALPDASGTTP